MLRQCLPSSLSSIQLTVLEEMSFEDFQDDHHDGHLGYQNGMILAILTLQVTPMPPTKFGLNLTLGLGADVVSRLSRWPPRWPSWTVKWNNFSNSEFLCCSNASHQVLAQSDLCLGGDAFEEFQDGHNGSHLGYRKGTILAILNLYVAPMSPIKFLLDPTFSLGRDVIWRISRWLPGSILDIWTEQF